MDAAKAMHAIIDPQYDSKISEPIPATSPTLSPTLSAITPGFLGSSSGIPASTFPTKSAPTSALFVNIPPPTLENKATEEAPTGIRQIDIPIIDVKMPLPENEILITASTTAVVSVAATLTATAAFKWVVTAMKPILKTTWKKLSPKSKG